MFCGRKVFLIVYWSIYSTLSKSSGAEIRTKYMIEEFNKIDDLESIVFSPNMFFKRLRKYIPTPFLKFLMIFAFFLRSVPLVRNSNDVSPVVYCGTCYWWDLLPALLVRAVTGVKLACVSHDSPNQLRYYRFLRNEERIGVIQSFFSTPLLRIQSAMVKKVDFPISISKMSDKYFQGLNVNKNVIHSSNGISQDYMLVNRTGFKYDIVYVGRVIQRKNIPVLLDSLKLLMRLGTEFKAIIITNTDKDYLKYIFDFVENNQMGHVLDLKLDVDESEKFALLSQTKISVNVSQDESFSISTLESAISGNALVLSDRDFFREIYGKYAIYVDPNDPRNLALTLRSILDDSDRLRKMQENSRNVARRYNYNFIANNEMEKICHFYSKSK